MEAWTRSDEGSRLYALLHEARIRREIILRSIEDDEMYISMVATMKRQYVFNSTAEEDLFKEKP